MTTVTSTEYDDRCLQAIVDSVDSLQKFRPRLFNNVRDICTALSSLSLPKLKKKFLKSSSGLQILAFTEVLFKQLFESHPKVIEEREAAYLVAMIQEMFSQIDYNSDEHVDWDEFTSFIIQNSLVDNNKSTTALTIPSGTSLNSPTNNAENSLNVENLDQYIIEYGEDILMRDRILSNHRQNSLMKFIPGMSFDIYNNLTLSLSMCHYESIIKYIL